MSYLFVTQSWGRFPPAELLVFPAKAGNQTTAANWMPSSCGRVSDPFIALTAGLPSASAWRPPVGSVVRSGDRPTTESAAGLGGDDTQSCLGVFQLRNPPPVTMHDNQPPSLLQIRFRRTVPRVGPVPTCLLSTSDAAAAMH